MPRHHCRALLLAAAGVVAASLAAFAATGPQVLTGESEPTAHAAAHSLPASGITGDSARCARFSITVYRACLDHALSHSDQVVSCRGHYEANLSRCRMAGG